MYVCMYNKYLTYKQYMYLNLYPFYNIQNI